MTESAMPIEEAMEVLRLIGETLRRDADVLRAEEMTARILIEAGATYTTWRVDEDRRVWMGIGDGPQKELTRLVNAGRL